MLACVRGDPLRCGFEAHTDIHFFLGTLVTRIVIISKAQTHSNIKKRNLYVCQIEWFCVDYTKCVFIVTEASVQTSDWTKATKRQATASTPLWRILVCCLHAQLLCTCWKLPGWRSGYIVAQTTTKTPTNTRISTTWVTNNLRTIERDPPACTLVWRSSVLVILFTINSLKSHIVRHRTVFSMPSERKHARACATNAQ